MVDPIDHSKLIAYQDNDQQKQWFDDSYWMNYYVGVNGGNDKVQYAASAGYTKDGGIGINTDFSRFTFHGNTSFKILRNLKATTVFDYSETKGNTLPSSGIATYWTTVAAACSCPPRTATTWTTARPPREPTTRPSRPHGSTVTIRATTRHAA